MAKAKQGAATKKAATKKAATKKAATKKPAKASTSRKTASKGSAKASAARPKGVEITGHSASFSFEEALKDALAQAHQKFPTPPRNPDIGVRVDFKSAWAVSGGNMRPGLYVVVTAS